MSLLELARSPVDTIIDDPDRRPPWEETLTYFVDTYPQIVDGNVEYLVAGGVALALLVPDSRAVGQKIDLDIITATDDFAHQFSYNHPVDAKSARMWLIDRDLEVSESRQRYILFSYRSVLWQGRDVLTVSPAILYLSKNFLYRGRGLRLKDSRDLDKFSPPDHEYQEALAQLL